MTSTTTLLPFQPATMTPSLPRPISLRTTEHYDRARGNLDRHGVHFLTAYVAGVRKGQV